VTTTFSWRLVFAAETVVVVLILLVRKRMHSSPKPEHPPRLDVVGAALSASGLALIVFGVLQSSSWGWVQPRGALTIAGREITPFGLSVVPFLILCGLGCLWGLAAWTERRQRLGIDTLLDLAMLRIVTLRAGLSTLFMQQLVLLGTFFVLPVYLQIVLGLDAFETGKRLIPMSVMMLIAALAGPRLAAGRSVKRVCQIGLAALAIGAGILLASMDVSLDSVPFSIGLGVFGVGAGLLASQLGNVIMSSVDPSRTNEAGGLQGTAQNLGASFGTALIGAILLAGLTHSFVERIQANPSIPPDVASQIAASAASKGLDVVTVQQAEQIATEAGLPADQAAAVAQDYGAAQLEGLQNALFAVAVFALLAFWFTRRLPARAGAGETAENAPPEPAPASV
jgi:Na+/melibiose symporter-like transporter